MTNKQIWPDEVQPVEELDFEHIESRYLMVVVVRMVVIHLILMACALLILTSGEDSGLCLLLTAECMLALSLTISVVLARRICMFKAYALRDKDISYRSGIFFTSVVTVPFGKIQQVSIRKNPVSRIFGLYYVEVANGSQSLLSRITIPGLTHEKAERIKSLLIRKADSCND